MREVEIDVNASDDADGDACYYDGHEWSDCLSILSAGGGDWNVNQSLNQS